MFKPMKYPNDEVHPNEIQGEYFMSPKLDGIRCLFIDGRMCSRSADNSSDVPGRLKEIRNVHLQKKFQRLKDKTRGTRIVLDGELYNHEATFQQISSAVMAVDKIPEINVQYHMFDVLDLEDANCPAEHRVQIAMAIHKQWSTCCEPDSFILVPQKRVSSKIDNIEEKFNQLLAEGYEGAILKEVHSPYKFGRLTAKSGQGYKLKPFRTFDARVKGITQATQAKADSARTRDAFGKSKTSKKKGDRELIPKAAAFEVDYNGFTCKVSLAMTDEEKEYIWNNQDEFIGRMIEFKGMLVGAKDRVRHPVFLRFRDDRE